MNRLFPLLVLVAVTALGASCKENTPPAQAPAPPEVTVAPAVGRTVREWKEFTGQLRAIESVEVRARVSGYLQSVHFKDGQIVEKGALLFVIDPRPYQAVLDAATAESARVAAALALARNTLARLEAALRSNATSVQEYDRAQQEVLENEAALKAADARVTAAQLDVEFTQVRSPIAGRIDRQLVNVGNLINGGTASATLLTTVVSLDPIYCYITGSEQDYLDAMRRDRRGERISSRDAPNPVEAALIDDVGFPHKGTMDFIDNQVDPTTGTIGARAVLSNPDGLLIPGLFVKLRVVSSGEYNAVLIPDQAIGSDQGRRIVFVVDSAGVATQRNVSLGPIIDGLRVVRSGLDAGERVVIEGLQRVRSHERVTPVTVALDEWLRRGDKPEATPATGTAPGSAGGRP